MADPPPTSDDLETSPKKPVPLMSLNLDIPDCLKVLYNKLLEGHWPRDIFECRAEYVDQILADLVKILMKFKLWELIIFMPF